MSVLIPPTSGFTPSFGPPAPKRSVGRGPHLIVMAEPTNHMDRPGIRRLEEALADCPCAMLLVSHDESFLEKITDTDWLLVQDDAGDSQLECFKKCRSRVN